ncbi:hydroxymethylglutaryl-coenzyme A synthase N terminal-domain-containing protein [Fimicolochytrium jonesii]|uniref:hydroxymethylglutaryl-coenzyme A synthase N terminal-domain-containing protein n=1 Tax=Fimicolochytrium jonesii TaxID=1396493 RepID=UPI0022FDD951|nr:hydroxymethylglutaryl-coenzyme A synthase N terminal-domain-containing protein [Fimicolochytrium jonesii]KAI8825135.1 hydroxymethylglutaryl-coenzyme A synthase N terminal-domain-containing protein [Fimicolochytrium jonesii]
MLSATPTRAENVGIHAMEIYFPKKYVDQAALETFDGVSAGKYTIGLGQLKMGICDDREDIHSICLTAVSSLLEKYSIDVKSIGRLEVGTETIIDKSKSVKSVLMQLFQDAGNTEIEGVDTTNACYGGTNALFNSVNWIESNNWDGRYALVVAADIAVYKSGAARPTGGAAAVAMLIGADAPLAFDAGLRATHMEHVYDFYKPDLHSEYPEVDGPLSNKCYTKAVDVTYNRYMAKLARATGIENPSLDNLDHVVFHCPYTKLVTKSVGRLAFNDFRRSLAFTTSSAAPSPYPANFAEQFSTLSEADTYTSRELEKQFVDYTKPIFKSKVLPSLYVAQNLGNSYCASLYAGLASLLSLTPSSALQGKRIGLFSYGSGLAASFFSLTVRGPTDAIAARLDVQARLAQRTEVAPERYDEIMAMREKTHNCRDLHPEAPVDDVNLWEGAYYLTAVDDKFRRSYARVEIKKALVANGLATKANGVAPSVATAL